MANMKLASDCLPAQRGFGAPRAGRLDLARTRCLDALWTPPTDPPG